MKDRQIDLKWLLWRRGWLEIGTGTAQHLSNAFRVVTTTPFMLQHFALGIKDVEPLERFGAALRDNPTIEFAFVIKCLAMGANSNSDGNELRLQQTDNFFIAENRHTAEHAVISRRTARIAVHHPHEQRLLFAGGPHLGLVNGKFPGNAGPKLVGRRLKLLMERFKVSGRDPDQEREQCRQGG